MVKVKFTGEDVGLDAIRGGQMLSPGQVVDIDAGLAPHYIPHALFEPADAAARKFATSLGIVEPNPDEES